MTGTADALKLAANAQPPGVQNASSSDSPCPRGRTMCLLDRAAEGGPWNRLGLPAVASRTAINEFAELG